MQVAYYSDICLEEKKKATKNIIEWLVWRSRFKPGSYKDINLQSAPYQLSRFN